MLRNIDLIAAFRNTTFSGVLGRVMQSAQSRQSSQRRFSFEPLEARQLLSANVGDFSQAIESAPVAQVIDFRAAIDHSLAAREQDLAISAVHLLVDGREVTITSLDQTIELNVGDELQIVGIEYRFQGNEVVSGKIAFEGYLNKLKGSDTRTDYRDGRFGRHVSEGEIPSGTSIHPGLDGSWKMTAGTESLTLVMVRYSEDGSAVEDRVNLRTQVGQPDFVLDSDRIRVGKAIVGRKVRISGSWGNEGAGTYRNYAEVNIYHESNPDKLVWAGTMSGVVREGRFSRGQFLNTSDSHGFSKRWTPEEGGTYILKFYADPENNWNESNEENNVYETKVEVSDLRNSWRSRGQNKELRNHNTPIESDTRDLAFALTESAADTNSSHVQNSQAYNPSQSLPLNPSPEGQSEQLGILSDTSPIAQQTKKLDASDINSSSTLNEKSHHQLEVVWSNVVDLAVEQSL